MQSPTALPRIPASASGVSKQRSGPKRSRRPAVARKTPPARPTSSPITITEGSRSSSTWNPSLIASTIESSAKCPPELLEIRGERGRGIDIGVREEQVDVRCGLHFRGGDSGAHRFDRLAVDRLGEIVVEDPRPPQVALEAAEAFTVLLLLAPRTIGVGRRIVCRRVR